MLAVALRSGLLAAFSLSSRPTRTLGSVMSAATSAPAVAELAAAVAGTPTGRRLIDEEAARKRGEGAPHSDAKLRLFGKSESDVRVTLYRDTAAWCPYCQKVWLLLEEKRVPYKITKINMRSYGDKPADYLRKVPNGLLPALEIDGQFMTDSIPIMLTLDAEFADHGPRMVPAPGSPDRATADSLLRLERELFRDWCSLTFQPGTGLFGNNKKSFEETLRKVDSALGSTPGPWFLGGEAPSLVDLQYVSHVERMVASLAYWKVSFLSFLLPSLLHFVSDFLYPGRGFWGVRPTLVDLQPCRMWNGWWHPSPIGR
jgi:glutathione S-transferase